MTKSTSAIDWIKYVNATKQQSIDQVAQQITNEHPEVHHAKQTLEALCSVVQPCAKYMAPALSQQQQAVAKDRHLSRAARVAPIVQAAIQQHLLHDDNPLINLFDWDAYTKRLQNLVDAFPEPIFNHAVAIKANPIRGVLRTAQSMGCGAECASYAEAKHALRLGFAPRKVVYDSPCKTLMELRDLLHDGVFINLDNEQEIDKVREILAETSSEDIMKNHALQIGLRINPVVGGGSIDATSTATVTSKFGLLLTDETADKLFRIFEQNEWLQGVHVHVGSQGCPIDLLVAGAKKAVAFANETNARLGRPQIQILDIGGGMPTIYDGGDQEAYDFHEYASALRSQVPELFTSGFKSVITEFGRSIFVKPGLTVSKIEALKNWSGQQIAVIHVGADQFPRTAYLPELWSHVITIVNHDGAMKKENVSFSLQDIAGPLCFSGDFMAKQVLLPPIGVGDFCVIHDTGGYTLSMFSKYNSRQAPAMYAYTQTNDGFKFQVLKTRETTDETLGFWGVDTTINFNN